MAEWVGQSAALESELLAEDTAGVPKDGQTERFRLDSFRRTPQSGRLAVEQVLNTAPGARRASCYGTLNALRGLQSSPWVM